jgi:hypothetical protein
MSSAVRELSVSQATEADLQALVEVRLSVFGRDTPDNRAKALEALLKDLERILN